MEDIFNRDITKEELNTFIAIASTNTAPSPTGLTFNMIKNWPEEVKKPSSQYSATYGQQRTSQLNGSGNGFA